MSERTLSYSDPFPDNPFGDGLPADPYRGLFRETTLKRVFSYKKRRRYLNRQGQLVEISRIETWAKSYRVYLKGQPDAFLVVAPDYPAFVRQGPCRRRQAS